MFERYTEKARRVIFFARYEASQFGSPYIETEHLLLGILREDKALIRRFLRLAVESIRTEIENHTIIREKVSTSVDLPLSNESKRVLAYSAEEAEGLGHSHIGTEHLLLGLLREEGCFAAQLLLERGLRLEQAREQLANLPHHAREESRKRMAGLGSLSPYTSDLVAEAQPLIGRENELNRLIELLCRFRGKNPVLVGEPGVGKKTIVGGLARRMADEDVPHSLWEKALLILDLPPVWVIEKEASGHEKVDQALVAAAAEGNIFFVNRMHDRSGRPLSAMPIDVAELLARPIMAGRIQCISTSTPAGFRKLQAERHWLAEYFEPIEILPSDEEAAIAVLQGIKGVYEGFHNVSYTDDAIAQAVLYAKSHLNRACLPGSAVDLIDAAGAAAQLEQSSLPSEVLDTTKRVRTLVQQLQTAIATHEFERAGVVSREERKERDRLRELRKKYKLDESRAVKIGREDIEKALTQLTTTSSDAIKRSRTVNPEAPGPSSDS
jgi:ATP-dependent Clp protease ATP-binding subunit ClpC